VNKHQDSGKPVRGESDNSFLHLDAPGKAVTRPTVSVPLEQGSPTVSVEIEGKLKRLIVGSNVSILQPGASRRDVRFTAMKPYGVTEEALDKKGQQHVSFVLGGRKFSHIFLVCPLPTERNGLFGTDFLERMALISNLI
jgi:hypothetical protein